MTKVASVCELAEQIRGVTYRKSEASPTPRAGYLPVLRAGNITEDGLSFDDLVYVPAERISKQQKIRRNDVVIAASSGSINVVGKAARASADFEGGFGAFCKVLRPGPEIDPSYFAHFFFTQRYRQAVSALAAGVNINNLRNEHLDEMKIPVPSPSDQRHIGDILNKTYSLRAKRRIALKKLDSFSSSIFFDKFGEPATNPNEWPRRDFEGTMRDETSRSKRLPRSAFLAKGQYRVIDQGQIDPAGYCDDQSYVCKSALPVIVFGDHTRVVKLVRGAFVVGADGAKVLVAQPGIEPDYLAWHLRTLPIPNLGYSRHMRHLKRMQFQVPPMELQREFSSQIAIVEAQRASIQRARVETDALFSSLQDRAFRSEV